MTWSLEEFADMDFSTQSSLLAWKQRRLHNTKVTELLEEGICFLLKSEYERVQYTLEGVRQNNPPPLLGTLGPEQATARVIPPGDMWVQLGRRWM